MAFMAIPFVGTAARGAAMSFLRPAVSTLTRSVVETVGQVAGQGIADQLSSVVGSNPLDIVVAPGLTHDLTLGEAANRFIDPRSAAGNIVRPGGTGGEVLGTTVGTPTHADVVANAHALQRAENVVAALPPRSMSPTPLPVSTAHDAMPVLQAQTPMDAAGPAATQGNPQPIPPVAPGLRALEVEPTRVYNQDHTAQLPPVTIMPTMQHQLVAASDPPPPPGPQGGSGGTGGGNGVLLAVGAVTVGGVIIFLWYRQKRA